MTPKQRRFRDYLRAAQGGDTGAALEVGLYYAHGLGVDVSGPQALHWLTVATRSNSVRAIRTAWAALGIIYLEGRAVRRDAAKAVRMFRRGAAAGSTDCMDHLGFCFRRGDGVGPSSRGALLWFRRGAELGSAHCQYELAKAYSDRGAAERAIYWYRRAARGKFPWAMQELGLCYHEGRGVKRSERTSRYWFSKAKKFREIRNSHLF